MHKEEEEEKDTSIFYTNLHFNYTFIYKNVLVTIYLLLGDLGYKTLE